MGIGVLVFLYNSQEVDNYLMECSQKLPSNNKYYNNLFFNWIYPFARCDTINNDNYWCVVKRYGDNDYGITVDYKVLEETNIIEADIDNFLAGSFEIGL